ncbi:Ig-like domain-containing protein [Leifsonia aquatica]|uniref:Ig-like domain-containing protein n=1 Tax=Leifsonia aquatica TaxID=144185 RepID=UPI00046A852F|nr:Ig-like domain-containing protein [Leifsonia aquatica]
MSRILRLSLVAAVAAVTAGLAIPSSANADGSGFRPNAPAAGSTIAPAQVFRGTAVPPAAQPGDEIRLHVFPVAEAAGSCSPATQVGSAFVGTGGTYEITMEKTLRDGLAIAEFCTDAGSAALGTVIMDNPLTVTSPALGATLLVDAATVTGTGSPGSTVTAAADDGTPLGSAVVDAAGAWTLTLIGAPEGRLHVTFTQDAKSVDAEFVVVAQTEGTPLIAPAIAAGAIAAAAPAIGALHLRRRTVRRTS